MKTPLIVLAAATLLSSLSAFASDCYSQPDEAHTYGCLMNELDQANTDLQSAFDNAMRAADGQIKANKLNAAEDAWSAFRDAECDLESDGMSDGVRDGLMGGKILKADCLVTQTKARIKTLNQIASDL